MASAVGYFAIIWCEFLIDASQHKILVLSKAPKMYSEARIIRTKIRGKFVQIN